MAEKRKRLKWGRWLLLALVALYFAPVIPAPWQLWDCGPDWQDGLNVEGCEPREGHEWVSPSSAVASLFMHQFVYTAHVDGQSYEGYTEEAAERRAGQARRWLSLARISTFRPQSLHRRIQRERAFLMQYDGDYARASRQFEWLTQYSRYALPGDVYVRIDFFYARRNAFLAGDMDRVWALTNLGLDGFHSESADERAAWLLQSADLAIEADDFDRANEYINRAGDWTEQVVSDEEQTWLRSDAYTLRGQLDLARYEAEPDPVLAEAALDGFRRGAETGGFVLTHQGAIQALSYLGRCEEADALIVRSLEQIDLAEPEYECFEPEGGVLLMDWVIQVQRCRLMRLGNRDGAAEACAELEAMVERSCTQSFWEPDGDRMRLYEPLPEPLACFAEN